MKKFISIVVAAVMLATMIAATAMADEVEYVRPGDNGFIDVPYTTGQNLKLDGILDKGEWSETNKIALNETNLVGWAGNNFTGPIDYYYSWGDKGLYMAAVVSDDLISTGLNAEGSMGNTRFQIALNPGGLICDDYAGLFFSIGPVEPEEGANGGNVVMMKHNWQTQADDGTIIDAEEGIEGAYTFIKDGDAIIGWNLECLIPWTLIATPDRYADLDENENLEDLTSFSPKDVQNRAWCTATIAYVQCSNGGVTGTGRTCTDGIVTWEVDSYDIILLFLPEGATSAAHETALAVIAEPETTTKEEVTEPVTTDEQTKDDVTGSDPGKSDDTTEKTEDGTKDPATTTEPTKTTKDGPNTGLIVGIVIAAVVVVAAVVAAIVLGKKKKK